MASKPDITCNSALDHLVAYVQDELGDAELARKIGAHIAECEVCRRQVAGISKTFQMARETCHGFVPSEQVWQELVERLHALGPPSGAGAVHEVGARLAQESPSPPSVSAPVPEAPVVPRKRRMIAAVITVAALVVVVAAAALWLSMTGFKVILKNGDDVFTLAPDGDQWAAIEPGRSMQVGSRVKTAPSASLTAVLHYPNDSTLGMSPDTELELVAENAIRLDYGEVTADITPAGVGFVVQTKFGDLEAIGTRFTVSVSREDLCTRLEVHEGRVRFRKDGVERMVEAGYRCRASKNMPPGEPKAVARAAVDDFLTSENLKVMLSVHDGVKYVGEMGLETPRIPSDAPLRVRFEVRNIADAELSLPTGRTGGNMILLNREGLRLPLDVTTSGRMLQDRPSTKVEDKRVRIAPGETYQFEYEIPLERMRMFKGGKYYIFGHYCMVMSRKIAVEVK